MSDESQNRFSGLARLYGEPGLAALRRAHVAVIGIGGVGSWTAEALARSGVGELTLVDLDDVCVTNTNRQIHALSDTVGQSKVQVMAERIATINPECILHAEECFLTGNNVGTLLDRSLDAVIDAIDTVHPKCLLLAQCHQRQIPVITCGAAGGQCDATLIEIADLSRTFNDALLHQVRKNLRGNYGFPSGEDSRKRFGIPAVFSTENTLYPQGDGCVSTERPNPLPPGLRCDAGFGSVTHVTAAFGLLAAGDIINRIAGSRNKEGGPGPPSGSGI